MTTALTTTTATDEARQVALLKAVGLERAAPEQRELALAIAGNYGLDLMLKHLVLVEGRPYITRDGLLHVAHRSGMFDGIEVTRPELAGEFWTASCTVYRRDMTRGFTYHGRYPAKGGNARYAPEMAVKVAEVMALRRAFDVSAPAIEERWDRDLPPVPEEPAARPTLAERARAAAASTSAAPEAAPAVSAAPAPVEAASEPDDEVADAEFAEVPEVVEAEPVGMTSEQFAAWLAEHNVAKEYAASVAATRWPGVKRLSDEQRAELAREIAS